MFIWTLGGLGALFSFASDAVSSAVGWAWDKVIQGIYSWLANGLALLIEWVWSVLDQCVYASTVAGLVPERSRRPSRAHRAGCRRLP